MLFLTATCRQVCRHPVFLSLHDRACVMFSFLDCVNSPSSPSSPQVLYRYIQRVPIVLNIFLRRVLHILKTPAKRKLNKIIPLTTGFGQLEKCSFVFTHMIPLNHKFILLILANTEYPRSSFAVEGFYFFKLGRLQHSFAQVFFPVTENWCFKMHRQFIIVKS